MVRQPSSGSCDGRIVAWVRGKFFKVRDEFSNESEIRSLTRFDFRFLTNLSRGIIAAEGTIKALSPRVNILNCFMDKVDIGIGLDIDFNNLDDEQLEELKGLSSWS